MTKNYSPKLRLAVAISLALFSSQSLYAGDVEISLPTTTDAFTVDQPAGTELMRVNGDGNVGIGTATPTSPLHVVDSGTAYRTQFLIENKNASIPNLLDYKGGYFWQKTAFDNFNGEPRFMLSRSRGTLDAPTANQDGDLMGQIEFRAYDGGVHRRGASMRAEVDGTVASSNMPGSLHFLTEPEGGSDLIERMVVRSDGKVGIGTATPESTLDVMGDVLANDSVLVDGATDAGLTSLYARQRSPAKDGAARVVVRTDTAGAAFQLYESNSTGDAVTGVPKANLLALNSWGATGVDNLLIGTGTAPIHFYNGNPVSSVKMSILPTGKVGIGTMEPTTTLHVTDANGSAQIDNGNLYLNFTDDNIIVDPTTGATLTDPGLSKGIYVTNNSTVKGSGAMLRLSSNVAGGAAAGLIGRSADPDRNGRASLDMWTEDPDGTRLPRMTVNYDGKVGIGTTIPSGMLDVVSAGEGFSFTKDGGNSYVDGISNDIALRTFREGDDIKFFTTSDDTVAPIVSMMIDASNGNVGIGPNGVEFDSPDEKLSVDGNIELTGSVLNASDKRLKKDITPLTDSLSKITQLQGVSYQWKSEDKQDEGKQLGLIAQDVEKIFPEIVKSSNDDEKMRRVNYVALVAVLIEGMKEQQKRIEALEAKLK